MEEMIDFLLGNLIFVIAIIWFVANIFRRKDKNQEETNQPQRTNRPVGQPRGQLESGRPNDPRRGNEQGSPGQPGPRRGPMNPRPVPQPQTAQRKPAPLPWETVPDEFESTVDGDPQGAPRKGTNWQDTDRQTVGQESYPPDVAGEARQAYESLSARQQELQEKLTSLDKGAVNDLIMRSPSRSPRSRPSTEDVFHFDNMDHKTVVQGFIWSEIFADPRAKRKARGYIPYQRRRRHG